MSESNEQNSNPKVSNVFLERRAGQIEAENEIGYERIMGQLRERLEQIHIAKTVEELGVMKTMLEKLDHPIRAISEQDKLVPQSMIENLCKNALEFVEDVFGKCRKEKFDSQEISDTKSALYSAAFQTLIRSVILMETFTQISEPRSPEKLPKILDTLQIAGLLRPERRPAIIEAIYPSNAEVIPLVPKR